METKYREMFDQVRASERLRKEVMEISHEARRLFDTLQELSERYRDKMISNTDAVVNTIYNGVTADGFVAAVENARDYITGGFWLNGVYAMAITLVIMAGLGVWAYFYYGKLKKRAILGTADVRGERVFTRPDDDDIFTFRS